MDRKLCFRLYFNEQNHKLICFIFIIILTNMNQKSINSKIIDFSLLALKVSSLNNERAKLAADSISLLYNSAQYAYFYNLKCEYSQVVSTLYFKAKVYGYLSYPEMDLIRQCNDGIQFCQSRIIKYGISGSIDLLSLIITGISRLSKKEV